MVRMGVCKKVIFTGPRDENKTEPSPSSVDEDDEIFGRDREAVTADCFVRENNLKRHRTRRVRSQTFQVSDCKKRKQKSDSMQSMLDAKTGYKYRWPIERYNRAEVSILTIMKAKGAVFGNPIFRQELRSEARKHIGDTGLLDHLLKHMDGKVVPGGGQRFRRCYTSNGMMGYWLESSDTANQGEQGRIQDPFWISPFGWKGDINSSQDPALAEGLKLLREEMAEMKREVADLVLKKKEENRAKISSSTSTFNNKTATDSSQLQLQEMYKEVNNWKSKTEQQLMGISVSLSSIQDAYTELEKWKAKIEEKLVEITSSLSSMQFLKDHATSSPQVSDSWKEWLGSADLLDPQQEDLAPWLGSGDLIDIKQEDLASWLETSDLVNIEPDDTVQDSYRVPTPGSNPPGPVSPSRIPVCTKDVELLKEEMASIKRDILQLGVAKEEDEEAQNSCGATDRKMELENSLLLLQEMYSESVNWKAKIERQLTEISNSLNCLQAAKQWGTFCPVSGLWK